MAARADVLCVWRDRRSRARARSHVLNFRILRFYSKADGAKPKRARFSGSNAAATRAYKGQTRIQNGASRLCARSFFAMPFALAPPPLSALAGVHNEKKK